MSFDFELQESLKLSETLYTNVYRRPFKNWFSFTKSYLESKAKLIEHLNPRTGRLVEPLEASLSPHDARKKITPLLTGTPSMHFHVLDYVEDDELAKGVLSKTSNLRNQMGYVSKDLHARIKPGMKLTRAFAAIFEHYGMTKDRASAYVGKAFESIVVHNKQCNLVVSANILDFLLSSDVSSFTSCHSLLSGGRKAGPLQYLHDGTTLIAYLYEKEADGWDVDASREQGPRSFKLSSYGLPPLPYKIWRQLIHIDLKNRSVLFMRHYGATTVDDTHKRIRKIIAGVCRHLDPSLEELKWKATELSPEEAARLKPVTGSDEKSVAFADTPRTVMCFVNDIGHVTMPRIRLTASMPCPRCGKTTEQWNTEHGWCKLCDMEPCKTCKKLIRPDHARDGECLACYKQHHYECKHCGGFEENGNAETCHIVGLGAVCRNCYARPVYPPCPSCKKKFRKSLDCVHEDTFYCKTCYLSKRVICGVCLNVYWKERDEPCPTCKKRGPDYAERKRRALNAFRIIEDRQGVQAEAAEAVEDV